MTNKTYSELLELVQALAGVDSFATSEQGKISALANRRLYQAYNSSPIWPRYMIAAQARPATDGVIARTYDNAGGIRNVSSATRNGTTATLVLASAVDVVAGMKVVISGLSGTVSPNGTQTVVGVDTTTVTDDTITFELDTTNTGTETYTGSGVMTPVAVDEIADFHRIWTANPYSIGGTYELDWFEDVDGAHVIGNPVQDGYWVGYKAAWPGPYTTSSTDIPQEFFFYAAHATYADFLRGDGQVDKAFAEEQVANSYLVLELDKAGKQRNINSAFRRITTYTSRQAR